MKILIVRSFMFKRKIYENLKDWKNTSNGSSALLIEGARRIGKSTLVENFGKNEYKSYILIDFSKASENTKSLFYESFERKDDLTKFFNAISLIYQKKLYERNSLIIFDEIQTFPRARELIKEFVEDGRYDFIETGSLISIKENAQDIRIPSEEEHIKMYPMDFEEFLWAINDEQTFDFIKDRYFKSKPVGESIHREIIKKFRQYMVVGGMPKVVDDFVLGKDYQTIDKEKRKILTLYNADIDKRDKKYKTKAKQLFASLPSQLMNHTKKFILSKVDKAFRYDALRDELEFLDESMTTIFSRNIVEPRIPFSFYENYTDFKLFMGDIGLLITKLFEDRNFIKNDLYEKIIFDKLSINEGFIYENAVACLLKPNLRKINFYTFKEKNGNKENKYEIDFIARKDNDTIPIEVKSSNYANHKSLDKYFEKYHSKKGYVIWNKDLKREGKITYIPIYMTSLIFM